MADAGQSAVPRFDVPGPGAEVIDELLSVVSYPPADARARVLVRERRCGGRTGTALVAAARLGPRRAYAGVIGRDQDSDLVLAHLARDGVDVSQTRRRPGRRPARAAAPHRPRRVPQPVHQGIGVTMRSTFFLATALLAATPATSGPRPAAAASAERRPNIVLILADDLGYGELGCYGQRRIRTPQIDRLAAEGLKFTRSYAGADVCAPSRCSLMTGRHTGHTAIRANGPGQSLAAGDVTLAEVLKQAGYRTGYFGKYGLGNEGTPGHPNRQGFDTFFGSLDHVHAHFYYPYFLWKDETRYALPANEGRRRGQYSQDEVVNQAKDFLRRDRDRPFFLYLAPTTPHVELVVPEDSVRPYRGRFEETPLPDPRPGYIGSDEPYATFAGMVGRLDDHVGQILALLKERGLDDDTLVFFTSDNGPQGNQWKRVADFFDGNGPLRGYKGEMYEGGLRVPMIARWPGRIRAGAVTDHVCAFWDLMPTLAELAGAPPPDDTDGISFVPTLLGRGDQKAHESLYWEIGGPSGPTRRAVLLGDWKAVQPGKDKPWELYDLKVDPGEARNVAPQHPDLLTTVETVAASAHTAPRQHPAPEHRPRVSDFVR